MLRYSANVSTLFRDETPRERMQRASEAGFNAIEFLFVSPFGLDNLVSAQDEYGLQIVLFDPEIGDPTFKSGYGYLGDPDAGDRFRRSLDEAIESARRLDCGMLNNLAGAALPGLSWEEQRDVMVERLREAAPIAAQAGITLLVEAISNAALPGYLVNYSRQGLEIVDLVDHPNVLFQDDLYHMQLTEGNLIATLQKNLDKIGHVQIADVPGRHEPGTGEVNYGNVLKALDEAGYRGHIGLEYIPIGEDPFAWMEGLERDEPYLRAA